MAYNLRPQQYKGITIQLINRVYHEMKAKRFLLIPPTDGYPTNQNVWIPNKHLLEDGTMKPGEDIDYVFRRSHRQLEIAGYLEPIPGIKRRKQEV